MDVEPCSTEPRSEGPIQSVPKDMALPSSVSTLTRGSGGAHPRDLLQPVAKRTGLAALLVAYLWALTAVATSPPEPNWPALLAPSLLCLGAAFSLRHVRQYTVAAVSLSLGVSAAALVAIAQGAPSSSQWLVIVPTLIIGLLTGPAGATLAAAVFSATGFFLGLPLAQQWQLASEALVGAVLVFLAGTDIVRALLQAEVSESRAWQLARESMDRRGELQQANKALHDTYALLERTNHELEIARREADEARLIKARFAAQISHELRTPLNLILGFSRLMYQSPEVYGNVNWTPALRLDIREIHRASRHLLGMIDDILDLSRIDAQRLPINLQPINLHSVVTEAAAIARGLLRGSLVVLSVTVPENLPEALVDRTRIRQVLLNLLTNAIRFTTSGEISIAVSQKGSELEIAVVDTGAGIPEKDLASIFDEFSQATAPPDNSTSGFGLGLAICKQIVQLHGGHITVQSKLGEDSRFAFTIPLPDSGKARSRLTYNAPPGWSPPLPSNRLGDSVVVIAHDEATARSVARGIEGFRIVTLAGEQALPQVVEKEHPAGVVLVRDPLAPEEGPSLQAIWETTGRADLGIIECEMPAESSAKRYLKVAAYLTKPVKAEELVAAIRDGAGATSTAGGRVLVVDDDRGFRALMERVIHASFSGKTVHSCATAEEALTLLAQESFDLLILDLVMPGTGGIELLRQARQASLLDRTRVIIVTGAPYVEELATILPTRLRFSKKALPRGGEWYRCIKALLDSAPPDYSLPVAGSQFRGVHQRPPAS